MLGVVSCRVDIGHTHHGSHLIERPSLILPLIYFLYRINIGDAEIVGSSSNDIAVVNFMQCLDCE